MPKRFFAGPGVEEAAEIRDRVNPDGDKAHLQQLSMASKYGEIFESFAAFAATRLEIPSSGDTIPLSKTIISVGDAPAAHKLMMQNPPKHPFYNTFGSGVFVETDPQEWRRQRKWLSPGFGMGELAKMIPIMQEEVEHTASIFKEEYKKHAAGQRSGVAGSREKFAQMTLSIIARVCGGVGSKYIHENAEAVSSAITTLSEGTLSALNKVGRIPQNEQKARQAAMEAIEEQNKKARQSALHFIEHVFKRADQHRLGFPIDKAKPIAEEVKDLFGASRPKSLTNLLFKRDSDGQMDEFAGANFGIILFAGHITTANSLSFLFYELAKNPDVQQKACREVDLFFAEDSERELTMRSLKRDFKFVNLVVLETLRKWPPVSNGTLRVLDKDTEIDGVLVQRGTIVNVPVYRMHHNPKLWPEPQRFDPRRMNLRLDSPNFLTFLKGPRNCLGMNLALMEMRIATIHFLRHFDISLADPSFTTQGENSITLGPGDKLPLLCSPRGPGRPLSSAL